MRKYLCSWEMLVHWNFLKKNKFLLRKITQVQGRFSDDTKRERCQFQNVPTICRVNDKTDLSSNRMHDGTWHREFNWRLQISSWPGQFGSSVFCIHNWMFTLTHIRKPHIIAQGQHTCLHERNVCLNFYFTQSIVGIWKQFFQKPK